MPFLTISSDFKAESEEKIRVDNRYSPIEIDISNFEQNGGELGFILLSDAHDVDFKLGNIKYMGTTPTRVHTNVAQEEFALIFTNELGWEPNRKNIVLTT